MHDAVLLGLALLAALAGMGWLALGLEAHWLQVCGAAAPVPTRRLRVLGAVAIGVALLLCLAVDHASMAVLVWVMAVAAGALAVALSLAWRAHWLRVLVPGAARSSAR